MSHIWTNDIYFILYLKKCFRYIRKWESGTVQNGGRSATLQIFPGEDLQWKGGNLQCCKIFPVGGRSAMLQIFRGKVWNVADLPGGLQGGRSAIQHRLIRHACRFMENGCQNFLIFIVAENTRSVNIMHWNSLKFTCISVILTKRHESWVLGGYRFQSDRFRFCYFFYLCCFHLSHLGNRRNTSQFKCFIALFNLV